MYEKEFDYVIHEAAREEDVEDGATGCIKKKEEGHDGWTLDHFCNLDIARRAKPKRAHVAVLRMYTGQLYKPWNTVLRDLISDNEKSKNQLQQWATCIAVLYDAIILLSKETAKLTVMRGVNISERSLPPAFTQRGEQGFAGGVEMGFMSTTASEEEAIKFSGGPNKPGVIFEITFTEACRGANLKSFSMFPQEAEYLFPPFTQLDFNASTQVGHKKYIKLVASMSMAHARHLLNEMTLDSCSEVPPWALTDQEGYYLMLVAAPPPVATGHGSYRAQSMRSVQRFADTLEKKRQRSGLLLADQHVPHLCG